MERDHDLKAALYTAQQMGAPIYVLFPGPEARDLADMVQLHSQAHASSEHSREMTAVAEGDTEQQSCPHVPWKYLLIAIDGTWRQGKEMYKVFSVCLGSVSVC